MSGTTACACLGPQNGDPACPCRMKAGFGPTYFGPEFLPLLKPAPEPKCKRCGLPQSACDFQRDFADPEPFF